MTEEHSCMMEEYSCVVAEQKIEAKIPTTLLEPGNAQSTGKDCERMLILLVSMFHH